MWYVLSYHHVQNVIAESGWTSFLFLNEHCFRDSLRPFMGTFYSKASMIFASLHNFIQLRATEMLCIPTAPFPVRFNESFDDKSVRHHTYLSHLAIDEQTISEMKGGIHPSSSKATTMASRRVKRVAIPQDVIFCLFVATKPTTMSDSVAWMVLDNVDVTKSRVVWIRSKSCSIDYLNILCTIMVWHN